MDVQLIIVGVIISAAVVYLLKTIRQSMKGHSCESANCGCESKKLKKV